IVERVTTLSAEILGSTHTSFWLERAGELRMHAQHGHTPEWVAALEDYTFPTDAIDPEREPYVVEPQDYTALVSEVPSPGGRYAVAPFAVDGRTGCIAALVEREDFGER